MHFLTLTSGRASIQPPSPASKQYQTIHPLNLPLALLQTGESVTNTDLIGWVTIGVQHIPRAEDVPLISNFGANFYIKVRCIASSCRDHVGCLGETLVASLAMSPDCAACSTHLSVPSKTPCLVQPWNYFDSMEAIDTDSDDTDEWESCLPDLEGAKTYKWSFN